MSRGIKPNGGVRLILALEFGEFKTLLVSSVKWWLIAPVAEHGGLSHFSLSLDLCLSDDAAWKKFD